MIEDPMTHPLMPADNNQFVPDLPPAVPRRHNRFTQWLGKRIMRLIGWRLIGNLPDMPQFIMIAAPHTSYWDFWLVIAGMWAADLKWSLLVKHTAFRWPLGPIIRGWGAVPVDRNASGGVVRQAVDQFDDNEQFVLALAPEGTRKKVTRWKSGFYRIAVKANVPIVCGGMDYGTKRLVLGEPFWPTGDLEADLPQIQAFFADMKGYKPQKM